MKFTVSVLLALAILGSSLSVSGDEVVIKENTIEITEKDLLYYALDRVPAPRRAEFFQRDDSVLQLAEGLLVIRALAAEAAESGLLDQALLEWQVALHRERLMMEQYLAGVEQRQIESFDWEGSARDAYVAAPEAYSVPEQVRVSHILIKTEDRSEDEARSEAGEVLKKFHAGRDFNLLALEYSEDQSAETNRGALGAVVRGRMVPEFEEAALALREPGSVAGPVETQFGYHLIHLDSYQPARQRRYEEVKDEIIASLKREVPAKLRQDTIIEARSSENIEINSEKINDLLEKFRKGDFD